MAEFTLKLSIGSGLESTDVSQKLWDLCVDAGLRAAITLPLGQNVDQMELGVVKTGVKLAQAQLRSAWNPRSLAALITLSACLTAATTDTGTTSTTLLSGDDACASVEPEVPLSHFDRHIGAYIGSLSINSVAPSIRHLFDTEPSEAVRAFASWLVQNIFAMGSFPASIQVEPEGGIEVLLTSPEARLSYSVFNSGFVIASLLDKNGDQTNWEVSLEGDTAGLARMVEESHGRFLDT